MPLRTDDRSALQQLARDQLPGLYAFAWHLAGSDAEDLVQETLLRACRHFDSLRDTRAGGRWLRVILANVWRDRLRRQQRRPDELPVGEDEPFSLYQTLVDRDPLPYSDTLHVDFLGAFSRHDVHIVLDRLPPRYRRPLLLRYVEGYSTKEVAELLDLPHGTVLSQLHRGRQHFERAMWAYAEESDLLTGDAAATPVAEHDEDGQGGG